MSDITEISGFMPSMSGMINTWSKNNSSTVTGTRTVYKSRNKGKCEDCTQDTDRVINYLGKLMYCCANHYK